MKTTVKTFAIISIITLGTASAFAKPANSNKTTQSKTVTTKTVTTTTTTKTVKEEPKKVASKNHAKPAPKKEIGHKRENENKRRHVTKHEAPKAPKTACKPAPAPVVKKVEVIKHPGQTSCKPATVVKTTTRPATVTVVKEVEVKPVHAEIDGASLAAGAIIGGIIGLTIAAAAN
ncbi:hypothetical protein [Treponema sp.]|uniref:hypothetical protein n=1 Tax=Treponema sp. TaxID=166 RepID=UPI00388FF550